MRTQFLVLTAALLGLSACASAGENRYANDLQKLSDDCKARGGILAPTGASTGRVETENVCRITGGASPRTSQDRN
jgi:hypothetical protein